MTTLVLIRHGQQVPARFPGDRDCPLAPEGEMQAEHVARWTASQEPFQALYLSPYPRVRQTAAPSIRALGIEAREDAGLGEITLQPEGADGPEAMARAGSLFRDHLDSAPPGKESVRGFYQRCRDTLEAIVERHPQERVLLFSHGGVIKMAFLVFFGLPLEESMRLSLEISHASAFQWTRTPKGWRMDYANFPAGQLPRS